MTVENLDLDLVADLVADARAMWREVARISAELEPHERALAETCPDDVAKGIAAMAPVLARNVHPEIVPVLAAILERADPLAPPPIEELPEEPLDVAELSDRVRSLERTLRAAGVWLSSGSGGGPIVTVAAAVTVVGVAGLG